MLCCRSHKLKYMYSVCVTFSKNINSKIYHPNKKKKYIKAHAKLSIVFLSYFPLIIPETMCSYLVLHVFIGVEFVLFSSDDLPLGLNRGRLTCLTQFLQKQRKNIHIKTDRKSFFVYYMYVTIIYLVFPYKLPDQVH